MADAITIQELIDARTDAKTLEQAVNGDAVTTVLSRLGETYPTLSNALNQIDSKLDSADAQIKQGITSLFENGGLPATPFKTKALMTASALANDKYAQVTDDTVNNGLYVKTAGNWVKSAYDPVTQAREDARRLDEKNLAKALAIIGEQPFQIIDTDSNTSSGYYTANGTWVADASYIASDFITVKKGDCILMHHNNFDDTKFSRAMLFDGSKTAVGALCYTSIANIDALTVDNKINLNVSGSELKRNQNTGIVIPQDGFIKLIRRSGIANATNDLSDFFAAKVTLDSLIDSTFTHVVPKRLLKEVGDKWFTPTADMGIPNNGRVILNPIAIGGAQTYSELVGKSVSIAYPVKKGQHVHIVGTTYASSIVASIVDSNNLVLQNLDIVSPFSAYNSIHVNPVGYFNIEVMQDGFLRVALHTSVNALSLVSISDTTVDDIESYYSYVNNGDSLTPYAILKPSLWANTSLLQQYGQKTNTPTLSSADYELKNSSSSVVTGNKPILLRKGDVLKFTSKSVMPIFGRIFTVGKTLVGGDSGILIDPAKTPLTSESIEQHVLWRNSGSATGTMPKWFGITQETTNYICNEDYDLLVYLFTGSSEKEPTHGSIDGGEIAVLSIDEYKKVRDDMMLSGLSFNKGGPANRFITDITYSDNILVFKNELLEFYPNSATLSVIPTSTYFSGRSYESITNYGGVTGVTFQRLGLSYDAYVDRGLKRTVKVNATSVVSVGFLDFFQSGGLYSVTNRRNLNNSKLKIGITPFDKSNIGQTLPTTVLNRETVSIEGTGTEKYVRIRSDSLGDIDTKTGFVQKGRYYAVTGMGLPAVYFLPFDGVVENKADIKTLLPKTACLKTTGRFVFTPPQDGIIMWQSLTGSRSGPTGDPLENIPPKDWFQRNFYEHQLYEVSQEEYLTSKNTYAHEFLDIPNDGSVNINFISRIGAVLDVNVDGLAEIRQGTSVLATIRVATANQGQSSSSADKSNINMEFSTPKNKKVYIRLGDCIEESELVAKSYYKSDRSQIRDSTCTDIWYEMRSFEPYPAEGVIPEFVLQDTRLGTSRYKARATTSGTPCEIYINGNFYGTYVLRNKKKRENYAMIKSDPNHILLQADYGLGGGYMGFGSMKLSSTEVRNPSMSGYTEGDATLPNPVVESNILRIFNWMKSALLNPVLFDTEGSEYIDLKSWHDYAIFSELVRNWDGLSNNYLLGTWDASVWHVFAYDVDQTIGSSDFSEQPPYGLINALHPIYSSAAPVSRSKFLSRYKKMRDTGVISIENLTDILKRHFNKTNSVAFDKNNALWDVTLDKVHLLSYMIDWFYKRIRYLDARWGYLPSDSAYLNTLTLSSIAVGGVITRSFVVPAVKTTDKIEVEVGSLDVGVTISAERTTNGTVEVTFSNTTATEITPKPEYIRIYID